MSKVIWTVVGAIFVIVVVVGTGGLILFVPLMAGSSDSGDGGGDCSVKVQGSDPVKDVTSDMKKNAEAIIVVAEEEKMPEDAAVVAIMVAMQESQLGATKGIDKPNGDGDAGIFQQRQKPGWYGTLEQVTDVDYAAKVFYKGVDISLDGLSPAEKAGAAGADGYHIPGLTDVDGWEELKPGEAAQKVQRSAFPDAYDKHESTARALVGGTAVECEDPGGGGGGSGDWDDRDGKTKPGTWGGYDNGTIPLDELDEIPWAKGEYLRPDSAADFNKLNAKFKAKFGYNIGVTDSYRSYAEQVAVKKRKGNMAATPGTSNHGWGMALDLGTGINNFGTKEHEWMKKNAAEFGWKHPDWAGPSGSLPEPWHWEYWGYPK